MPPRGKLPPLNLTLLEFEALERLVNKQPNNCEHLASISNKLAVLRYTIDTAARLREKFPVREG